MKLTGQGLDMDKMPTVPMGTHLCEKQVTFVYYDCNMNTFISYHQDIASLDGLLEPFYHQNDEGSLWKNARLLQKHGQMIPPVV